MEAESSNPIENSNIPIEVSSLEEVIADSSVSPATITAVGNGVDSLMQKLIPLAQNAFSQYLGGDAGAKKGITFPAIVLIAMQTVEQYSTNISKLAGPDKLAVAKELVPKILALAVLNNAITQEQADSFGSTFNTGADIVGDIVEAYILISNNPAVIQLKKKVKEEAAKCWAGCKTRCAKKK